MIARDLTYMEMAAGKYVTDAWIGQPVLDEELTIIDDCVKQYAPEFVASLSVLNQNEEFKKQNWTMQAIILARVAIELYNSHEKPKGESR